MTDITELVQRLATCAKEDAYPCLSPADCGALVEALEKAQATEAHCNRGWNEAHEQEARAEAAQKRIADLDAELEREREKSRRVMSRIAELESQVKFPGVMRCNTCGFSRSHVIVTPGGMRAGESTPERCPNGCGPLWHDTYRRQYNELYDAYKELESFRTAYMEWSDKTDWVNTDRRFGVVKPLGKHRADVLKAYIEHLESRTIAVKLPDFRTTYKGSFADEVEHQVRNALDAFSIAAGIKWEAE
ncbi:TPA: hypothetical protein ACTW3Y_004379 [Klebsiella pneumoniae]